MAAPLAVFEENGDAGSDEWPEFIDFRSSADVINSNGEALPVLSQREEISPDNFNEMRSSSIEDLVNNFDDKLAVCFRNYNMNTEPLAPVKILSQEEMMKNCKLWKQVTDQLGQVMPLDWQNSHTRRKHMPTLRLVEKRPRTDDLDLELSEDEELLQSLDLHSMILSSRSHHDVDDMDTPVVTADEVIEELDEMFQSTDTTPDEVIEEDRLSNISRELQALRNRSMTTSSYEESKVAQELKNMTLVQLNEVLEELDQTVKEYSEVLVQQLALREDLDYEKETKNSFISALLSVQNKVKGRSGTGNNGATKQKVKQDPLSLLSNKLKLKNGIEPGMYLTTRIPYHKDAPPDLETLRIITKILKAIDVDSKEVPDLLTNYILKVLFPAGADPSQASSLFVAQR
ncbi:fasciculation and elongation protein zeta-2 [Strongylocentrotus purpuratus]|uniref:Fasciculation and elongation protein zeta-2 n=1 Tax=Strongylocentrotus purpuratus TaxID=7668 RepID=A0A7M7HMZ1_STRPU|nr:fasciculation and elongation protein zeta-2 [Strongylocentrotus purpuratus]